MLRWNGNPPTLVDIPTPPDRPVAQRQSGRGMNETEKFFVGLVRSGVLSVTPDGVVFNHKTGRGIGAVGTGKYPKISCKDLVIGKIRHIQIHRLVWLIYRGPIPNGYEINHLDLNKLNPSLDNLELTTRKGNTQHAIMNGRAGAKFKKGNSLAHNRVTYGNRYVRGRPFLP